MTAKRFPFPAWPEIQSRHHLLCLPTLFRAIYVDRHVLGTKTREEEETIEKSYLTQFTEEFTPEYIEQLYNRLGRWGDSKEHANILAEMLSSIASRPGTLQTRDLKIGTRYWQARIVGMNENFYSAKEAFSFSHEYTHMFLQLLWLYSSNTLTSKSLRIHEIINSIMTKNDGQREEIAQLWDEFKRVNTRLETLVQKFEPLEEIFANYFGLHHSPPDVENAIKEELEQKLKEKNLYEAYIIFSNICETGLNNDDVEAPFNAYNIWCAIYHKTTLTLEESAAKTALIYNHPSGKKMQSLSSEESDLQCLFDILDESSLKPEVFIAIAMAAKMWEMIKLRYLLAFTRDFSAPGDRSLSPPFILLVGVKGKILPVYFSMFMNEQLSKDIAQEIFLESIRQQLSHECGLHCPYMPLGLREDVRLKTLAAMEKSGAHCPLFSNGNACCGWNEALWNLYRRLPEEQQFFSPPTCPATT